MTPSRLRAAVVGLGWAGQQHMAAYADLPDVDLVGLAGMEPEPLRELGERFGVPKDGRFSSWQDLLEHCELDVLSVAAPTTLHRPIGVAALDAGIHVLSEKPLAENAAMGRQLVEAAVRNDRVLDVSFNHRRRGVVKALKQVIDEGRLGAVYYVKAGWLRRQGIPTLGSWFTRRETAGGGPLMDLGVHMLDIVLHLLGEPQVRTATAATYAEFGPRGRGGSVSNKSGIADGVFDVEDLSTAFLRLSSGATLLLECSWAQWVPEDLCYVTVYGGDGGAGIEWVPTMPKRSIAVWTEQNGQPEVLRPALPPDGDHTESVADFLALVRSSGPRVHGRAALVTAEIIDACYESAAAGHEIAVSRV
ncbi:MAG TPA: Gfo/Idh/MocA family oxidoreductase [Propionibacteriaceae bacterium]|nr:Gfo/Idh/MocA family oxidoreductase [Propionibacteriaceae bacterium]